MKRIAGIIVALYAEIFIVLTVPVMIAAFYPEVPLKDVTPVFQEWGYWLILAVLLLCQYVLLIIPVKLAQKRPLPQRSVYIPIIVSGFLIGCLLLGAICAAAEFIKGDIPFTRNWQNWSAIGVCVLAWTTWALIFSRLSKKKLPQDVITAQSRYLLRGSILALLIAVPTHIMARHRDYCCAGFYTFIGITFGLAIMLISFGPGIFFLYASRWKQLHPEKISETVT